MNTAFEEFSSRHKKAMLGKVEKDFIKRTKKIQEYIYKMKNEKNN